MRQYIFASLGTLELFVGRDYCRSVNSTVKLVREIDGVTLRLGRVVLTLSKRRE